MQKIVVLNPKGGSGKTTIATNLASYFAVEGLRPTLMDMDAQGSSTHWLSKRVQDQPLIRGIAAFERSNSGTRRVANAARTSWDGREGAAAMISSLTRP